MNESIKIWCEPVKNEYEINKRLVNCDLRMFSCSCKFNMDIRGRCHPFKLRGIEVDSKYYELNLFIDCAFKACPYKLQCAHYFINDDACSCHINQDDKEELISFISSYEELFSLNENEIQTLYKMMILDNNNYYYHSMEEIDEVYQKYLSEKDDNNNDN